MAGRYYKYKDKELPSVTTITGVLDKPGLVYWSAGCVADYVINYLNSLATISVTGVDGQLVELDPLLSVIEKSRKEFRSVSRKAMDTGSQVHAAIEEFLKSGKELLIQNVVRLY